MKAASLTAPRPGKVQVYSTHSWCIQWVVGRRTRCCAKQVGRQLGESVVQRAAKRHDDDDHNKYVGLTLLLILLAAAYCGGESAPSTDEQA